MTTVIINIIAFIIMFALAMDAIMFGLLTKGVREYDNKYHGYSIFFSVCTIMSLIILGAVILFFLGVL